MIEHTANEKDLPLGTVKNKNAQEFFAFPFRERIGRYDNRQLHIQGQPLDGLGQPHYMQTIMLT